MQFYRIRRLGLIGYLKPLYNPRKRVYDQFTRLGLARLTRKVQHTMAHELMGDRFLERNMGTPAWHGLGTIFPRDEKMTASEACVRAGANINIIKVPEYALIPGGQYIATGDYMVYREESTFGGVTDPGMIIGGPVSNDYTPLQNVDIAAAIDPLSGVWPVETCGVLKDGRTFFLTLNGGEFDILGDPHQMYFLVSDSKSGTEAMKIMTTPVRVVCSNTLNMGTAAANFTAKVAHNPAAYRDLGFWAAVIPQIRDNAVRTKQALELLATTKATDAAAAFVFEKAFKGPNKSSKMTIADTLPISLDKAHSDMIIADSDTYEYFNARTGKIRAAAKERYDVFNQENPKTAGTLFAVAQAANEVAVWRNGHAETVEESVVFGERGKESARAFSAAYNIAQHGLAKARTMR